MTEDGNFTTERDAGMTAGDVASNGMQVMRHLPNLRDEDVVVPPGFTYLPGLGISVRPVEESAGKPVFEA